MKRGQAPFLGFFSLFVLAASAQADTVVLKNGAKIEGRVIQRRPDFIEVDRGGPSVIYRTDDILRIEWSDPSSEMKEGFSLPPGDTELLLHQGREVKAAPRAQRPALAEAPPRASAQRPALAEAPPRASAQKPPGKISARDPGPPRPDSRSESRGSAAGKSR